MSQYITHLAFDMHQDSITAAWLPPGASTPELRTIPRAFESPPTGQPAITFMGGDPECGCEVSRSRGSPHFPRDVRSFRSASGSSFPVARGLFFMVSINIFCNPMPRKSPGFLSPFEKTLDKAQGHP